ncbi:class I adenylate-forming enzyme family protein [Aspergillus puulaauensis]|uniref:AMP-dependent synthetase/ligase domain-containing protein n=1 Tax=Aspergillus puulaauensis TaxID=1220207 RepID=A0A7R8AQ95_9EURO|nr:uncharacterized protein APUU_61032S [Aspergillus puulaauensis]BCS27984.1 hypothetical protein APUU_61032S [Aspergillus puulaauensis]
MTRTSIQVPDHLWLRRLYEHWRQSANRTFIKDLETGKEATFTEFLYEVLSHRDRLKRQLSAETLEKLQDPSEEIFIATVSGAGFDFMVLLLAIQSLGAIVVPLNSQVHLEEAHYFLGTCNASLITSSQLASQYAETISSSLSLPHLSFAPSNPPDLSNIEFELVQESHDDPTFSPDRGFCLLYTSGTTGPSKGVLTSCRSVLKGMENYQRGLALSPSDKWLHHAPAHWKGGFDFQLVAAYTGASIEICNSVFSPGWFWERMQNGGGITCFQASPTLLTLIQERFDCIKGQGARQEALKGLRDIRIILTGSMRVQDCVKDSWRELLGGKELVNLYGMTEVAGMVSMTDWTANRPVDHCGWHNPELTVKANESGEICVKGPLVMKRYLSGDPTVNSNALDADGFYKTGDMGKVGPGGKIYVLGRASQDVIRSMGYKCTAADIEDPLRSYPGVSQAFVLGVDDLVMGQRVTALLLRKTTPEAEFCLGDLKLANLRWWLAVEKGLPAFKLPTLLRIIRSDTFTATTDTGKPSKKKIASACFKPEDWDSKDVQVWDIATKEKFPGNRAWDWEGRSAK